MYCPNVNGYPTFFKSSKNPKTKANIKIDLQRRQRPNEVLWKIKNLLYYICEVILSYFLSTIIFTEKNDDMTKKIDDMAYS